MRCSLSLLLLGLQGACAAPAAPARPPVAEGSDQAVRAPALWIESLDAVVFDASEPPRRRASVAAAAPRRESPAVYGEPPGRAEAGPASSDVASSDVDARTASALERLLANDLEGAAVDLEQAFLAAAGTPRGSVGRALADAWLGLGRYADASGLYEDLLGGGDRLPGPHGAAVARGNLAVAYYRLGRDADARREVGQALALRPEHADAMKTLGLIEQRGGRHDDAAVWFERALRIDPLLPEARLAVAERAEALGDRAVALAHYEQLLSAYEAEKGEDFHRRWRNLFQRAETNTGGELRRRVTRLRASLAE